MGTQFSNGDYIRINCDKSINYIFSKADNIFDWNGHTLPEKLCFYRNLTIWFSSIFHEELCFIHNETKKDIEFLENHNIYYSL